MRINGFRKIDEGTYARDLGELATVIVTRDGKVWQWALWTAGCKHFITGCGKDRYISAALAANSSAMSIRLWALKLIDRTRELDA